MGVWRGFVRSVSQKEFTMSMQAFRYRHPSGDLRLVPNRLDKLTKHHVPARNPDKQPRFIRKVDERYHRSYHLLFQAAASYEDACAILWHDWWCPPAER